MPSPCSSSITPRGAPDTLRAGQALRGSSEFHAWGDSHLYLRRDGDDLTLAVEHYRRLHPAVIPGGLAIRGNRGERAWV
jgi:hypothetical protein